MKPSLWEELKRRRVVRVGAVYLIAGWVVIQVAATVVPHLPVPAWLVTAVIVLVALGFPIALVLAWAFDLTPAGVERTSHATPGTARPARWLRFGALGLATVLVLVLAAALARSLWTDDADALSENAVAILPFGYQGGTEFAYLREGLVNMLSTKLDGAGELRSIDPRAAVGITSQEGTAAPGADEGGEIARRLGAGLYITGDVVEVRGRVQINAVLYSALRGNEQITRESVEGKADSIFELVDNLAARLLSSLSLTFGARLSSIAATTTSSLPALKAYLEGEELLRTGEFDAAIEAFQKATTHDSTFALAYYRASLAAEWAATIDPAPFAEMAVRHSSRLADRDRRLLSALQTWRRGAATQAEAQYREILADYPNDVEAWFELGEVLFHYNAIRGRSMAESEEAWRKVLSFEPHNLYAKVHLARALASANRTAALDTLGREVMASHAASRDRRVLQIAVLRALAVHDTAALQRVNEELRSASRSVVGPTINYVVKHSRNLPAAADWLGQLRTVVTIPDIAYGQLPGLLAMLEASQGRLVRARSILEPLERGFPGARVLVALVTMPHDLAPPDTVLLARLHEEAHGKSVAAMPAVSQQDITMQRGYLSGLLAAMRRDASAAEQSARELEGSDDAGTKMLAGRLASSVRAHLAARQGRTAEALAMLERMDQELVAHDVIDSNPFLARPNDRYLRATLLQQLGRTDEALDWYATIGEATSWEMPLLAAAHLHRGELYEQKGDIANARVHYARFVELWQHADPQLQPAVQSAAQRLARLGPDRSGR